MPLRRSRVLLADNHKLVVEALKELLEPKFEVVGLVFDGRTLVTTAVELQPDVIVLEIAMPQLNGLDAGRQLKLKMPRAKLIFLTLNQDPYIAGEALRAGASGYLLNSAAARELTDAIEQALIGRSYVSPQVCKGLTDISLRRPESREHRPELTTRQREVVQLLVEGRTMKEVGDVLKITARTVACHKYGVMEVLQIKSNAELVQYAIRRGILSV